jgi:hypothetical protein
MKTPSMRRIVQGLGWVTALGAASAFGGPSDGVVIGATKIVDNGPDNQRFNLVLIAEGYKTSELAQFAQHAQYFADTFFQTPPFNTNCSIFNVWRIDVSSTDSGADDPATCGDGSTGSGATVNTYFDATFCGDGSTRRLLTANTATAINVLNAQVPDWDTAVIIVNTTEYGGAGGGSVGVTSVSGSGWPQIAIHEFGHSAFALADEYDYRQGCGVDAPGTRDHHPAAEPAAANVTVETNPALVKWRDLFYPSIAIPTTVNADCTQCDPQGDPFPGQVRVGLYEGADYYHCDCYRPVYNCKFRVLAADFCPVCIRRMLQVLAPYAPANNPPVCNAGGPYVAECAGATTSVALDGSASSDKDCNTLTFTWTGPFVGGTATGAKPTVQFPGTGVFTVNLAVSDGIATTTCSVAVTIHDTQPPVIVCPANLVQPTDPGQCNAVVTFVATAVDICDANPSLVCAPPSGSTFPKGATTVNCTATDGTGNSAGCSFSVTVVDQEPPNITCTTNQIVEFVNITGAPVNYPPPAVTDNCPGVAYACVPPAGSVFPIGTTTVHCTATDTSGNTAACTFKVTVLGALGVKQNVLQELIALRATLSNKQDKKMLSLAIVKLTESLDPALWVDQTHVVADSGDRVFQDEKDAVTKLRDWMKLKKSSVPDATLQGFIDRIVKSDRLLAQVIIQDALMASGDPKKITQAQKQLATGNKEIALAHYESGIEHYRNAWVKASMAMP